MVGDLVLRWFGVDFVSCFGFSFYSLYRFCFVLVFALSGRCADFNFCFPFFCFIGCVYYYFYLSVFFSCLIGCR